MPDTALSQGHASRLVRRLTELGISAAPVHPDRFAERIGAFLGMSEAVVLSKTLGETARPAVDPSDEGPAAIRSAFLNERTALVRDIGRHCTPRTGSSRNRLPGPAQFHANCMRKDVFAPSNGAAIPNCAAAFDPYRRFYLSIQGRLDIAAYRLRMRTARAVGGLSTRLAGLATLDRGLNEAMYAWQQPVLSRIPTLLADHFNPNLRDRWAAHADAPEPDDVAMWMAPAGWIAAFMRQMQALLLAELEIRLYPVLGLIEAMGQTDAQQTTIK